MASARMNLDGGTLFLLLGGALLAAHAAHVVGERAHVPRVTLLLLVGLACGPSALDVVPHGVAQTFPVLAQLALAMVAFLLGAQFFSHWSEHGWRIFGLAAVITLLTAFAVTTACLVVGAPMDLALVLGSLATATDPAASLDVVRETRARGPLTDTLIGIVALDDILGITIFSFALGSAERIAGGDFGAERVLVGLWDVFGGAGLGVALGLPMAWLTGRLKPGEPAVLEIFGFVVLTAGIASLIEVSFLMAGIALGGTVALRASHYRRAVHEIDGLSEVLLALFFLMAGFSLEVSALAGIGGLGIAYVGARVLGRVLGAPVAARLTGTIARLGRDLGWCLLPQAGVALGLALVAAQRLPHLEGQLMPLVIGSTVFFELLGPPLTRWRLGQAGERPRAAPASEPPTSREL